MDYESFLRGKIPLASFDGYACEISDINPLLREHQSAIVQWAVKLGRRGQGSELNTQYFLDSVQYLQAAEREVTMPSLFDMVGGDA